MHMCSQEYERECLTAYACFKHSASSTNWCQLDKRSYKQVFLKQNACVISVQNIKIFVDDTKLGLTPTLPLKKENR